MGEYIKSAIEKSKNTILTNKRINVADDRAFSYVLLEYFFEVSLFQDQDDLVTDGANDGGIDFLYYDDDENQLHVCQSKYTSSLTYENIIKEFNKMSSTIANFKNANTGSYDNERLKKALQNALDRLPDEDADNIVFDLFTTAQIDTDAALTRISRSSPNYSIECVSIYSEKDIESKIKEALVQIATIDEYNLLIDNSDNCLTYESNNAKGAIVNLKSQSLIALYNLYASSGLFDLNIRRYVPNKVVDTGINLTLDDNREDFWFLNNGIIIACKDYTINDDSVTVRGFSIVNGGQTTTLIGKYKGENTQNFYIQCKLVAEKNKGDNGDSSEFFTRIAEATNSQKPIYPRDLKSNTPEMRRLSRWLLDENIFLEIKRGVKNKDRNLTSIKNDELSQILMSMIYQRPGTARSNKKSLFENPDNYKKIFNVDYGANPCQKAFIIDLINLYKLYNSIEADLKSEGLNAIETEVLKNGKQIIFALLGVVYRLTNEDLQINTLNNNLSVIKSQDFVYGRFISSYNGEDLEIRFRQLIVDIVRIVADAYNVAKMSRQTTSVSNFFKTDNKYEDLILKHFVSILGTMFGADVFSQAIILRRENSTNN